MKLNFGCGRDFKNGYINADITPFSGVDKSFDFNSFPYPFSSNQFDQIFSDNVIEHLDDIPAVLKELHRICKHDGIIRIIVPHYNCYGAYNDVTHKHYFSHLAFEPFYKPHEDANYFIDEVFSLKKIDLVPTRFGKLFFFDTLRLPLSAVIGQIYKAIDVTLIVDKSEKPNNSKK